MKSSATKNRNIEEIKTLQTISESAQNYRTLFETMQQGVFYQNSDGVLTDVNHAALKMLGLTRDEFLARTSYHKEWKVIKEDGTSLKPKEHPSMRAFSTKKPVTDTIVGVYNPVKKQYIWMIVNALPQFRNNEKRPFQVVETLHDITRTKMMEDKLRESEADLNRAQEITLSGSWKFDIKTQMPSWSKTMFTIFGLDQKNGPLNYLGHKRIIHPDDWVEFDNAVRTTSETGKGYNLTIRIIKPDGEIRWIRTECETNIDSEGNIYELFGITQDITDRKQTEENLKEKVWQLEQSNNLMVNREFKMIELKKEVNELLEKLGEKHKYKIVT
jgi:PAS domain S-box-containing protein